ncbi:hypothetical protein G4Y79_04515 [Phototrophicus methaneseepsis]|uniref:Uncharacterized protein n=1 Tax=Phototrophicus methaneseepsis TaxID=2710758 RepID=A0A7S8EAZ6_9CHLR|nr:hypothetical protein [Phototrophicus methaneseepsis]QPC83650.1 hypothetical protein G4Y79_04515 [Phototrophicus methaneseepsis]
MIFLQQYSSRNILCVVLLLFLITKGVVSAQTSGHIVGRVDYCSVQAGDGNYRAQEYYQFSSSDGNVRDLYAIDSNDGFSVCRHVYSENHDIVYYAVGNYVQSVNWSDLTNILGTDQCLNALYDPTQAPMGVLTSVDSVEMSAENDLAPLFAGDLLRPAWHGAFPQPGYNRVIDIDILGDMPHKFTFSVDFASVVPSAGGPLDLDTIEEMDTPDELAWLRDALYHFYATALGNEWQLAAYQERCGAVNPCVDNRSDIRITFEAIEQHHLIQLLITPNIMERSGVLDVTVLAEPFEVVPRGYGILAGADFSPTQIETELDKWNIVAVGSGSDGWKTFVLQDPDHTNHARLWSVTRSNSDENFVTDQIEELSTSGSDVICDPATFLPAWTGYVHP